MKEELLIELFVTIFINKCLILFFMKEDKLPSAGTAAGYGCLYVPLLFVSLGFKIPALFFEDMRRRKLEHLLEKEGRAAYELIHLESTLNNKIRTYTSAVSSESFCIPLEKEVRSYDPEALLLRFFAAQKIVHDRASSATALFFSDHVAECEAAVLYDAYFQILERNGYVTRAKSNVSILT